MLSLHQKSCVNLKPIFLLNSSHIILGNVYAISVLLLFLKILSQLPHR